MPAAEFDPQAYVAAAAPAVGLTATPEIVEALALVARIAAPALGFSVPEAIEPAPVFSP